MAAEIHLLNSSSKGNCCLIRNGSDLFLIDAGVSAKRIRTGLAEIGYDLSSIRCIFLTHEHSDHIRGLETIYHLIGVPLYAPSACFPEIRRCAPAASPYLIPFNPGDFASLQETRLHAVATPHDALGSVGFRMDLTGETAAYFTDMGHLTEPVVSALSGCRRVVIESNYDPDLLRTGPYPPDLKRRIAGPFGHLSNTECASLLPHLLRHGTEKILLAHLSEQNNTPAVALATCASHLPDPSCVSVASPCETVSFC
ncbi:MAG: MBL fold metallo-hydrolase [Clostridia bacterium]|nr:MBL fold metallo-hydrolase [Clostridia bacterium]